MNFNIKNKKNKIPFASKFRAVFEFIIPVVIAIVVIVILLLTEIQTTDNSSDSVSLSAVAHVKCLTNKSSSPAKGAGLDSAKNAPPLISGVQAVEKP